ncbi:HAD-IIB family hydrolase [Vibrio sp. TH_r3]|uniref:HAD-IIB family hydrolase n=1 Tax=Vibrio sp. TH_r3 TaxID=3082084 RepID=UPI002954E52B|nr:HAD-IIB family hydrolase [Vibrio sp. TH_r3]MDV7105567.1 HAD-IIB family hydrolase [Vibrio sp. TH_r3]
MNFNNRPEIIFTDVDDTLTLNGELPVSTLVALYRLRAANILVIPVTGACAGWCDQIARLWPVSAVIGENGAFCIEKSKNGLKYIDTQSEQQRQQNYQHLKRVANKVLSQNSSLGVAQDNAYRRYDLAIDYNQQCKGTTEYQLKLALDLIHSEGIRATASSIHINIWKGEHDKKHGALLWLDRHYPHWTLDRIKQKCAYIGDSLNDDAMFGFFNNTIAVANIAPYLEKLQNRPNKVLSLPGGEGFAEWVDEILSDSNN